MVRVEGNLTAVNYRERRCCEQRPDPSWGGWCGVSDPDRSCTLERPDNENLRIYFTFHQWNGMDHTSMVISPCINVDDKLSTCFIMQIIPFCLAALISGSIMHLGLETYPVISSAMLWSSGVEKKYLHVLKVYKVTSVFFLISSGISCKVVSVAELHFLWHTHVTLLLLRRQIGVAMTPTWTEGLEI